MRERSPFPRHLILAWVLAFATAAQARPVDPDAPSRYLGHGVDSGLVFATSPLDGRLWSAWTYRSGAESDIAVSVRDASGIWSEPVLLGAGDGKSQIDPALVFDARGNLYVAHTVRETGSLLVMKLAAGATRMSSPVHVSPAGARASSPTLMLSGNSLVVGYRIGRRVELNSLPLKSDPFGVQDGPDGFPPTQREAPPETDQTPPGE
jgi:hypothetical protein